MEVFIVPTERVGEIWGECSLLLEKAISRTGGRYTAETVRQNVESGDYQLFIAMDAGKIVAACTTRIAEYPNANWLCVVHCGGSHLEEWLKDGFGAVETWARINNCVGVEIIGRREWAKVLGMKVTEYRMEKSYVQ